MTGITGAIVLETVKLRLHGGSNPLPVVYSFKLGD